MFDVSFFKEVFLFKQSLVKGKEPLPAEQVYATFERLRRKEPFIFNIETTNVCNMQCIMCPRTKLMTRKVRHMDMDVFEKIVRQIHPHMRPDLDSFDAFVKDTYKIVSSEMSENAFYFFISSRHLTLHGYGEPLLDPLIVQRVALCSQLGIPTYLSCVPANINVPHVVSLMRAGLGVIKFSIDAMDDDTQKKIRGPNNNFTTAMKKIDELLVLKAGDPTLNTRIVVTMIALSHDENTAKTNEVFKAFWAGKDVYCYVKSQDNRWHYEADPDMECESHYEQQYCEYPWTSLSIDVDGQVVPCTQDYNSEMDLGDAKKDRLYDIWNGSRYDEFRKQHILGFFSKNFKCRERCDQHLVCDRLVGGKAYAGSVKSKG